MILRAIIEEIVDDGLRARVRIPRYNKSADSPTATPFDELYIAPICCAPGLKPALVVGDIVFVSFEDDEIDQPVIIGTLFREGSESLTDVSATSSKIEVNCELPRDTTIGDVKSSNIETLLNCRDDIQGQIDYLDQRIKRLEDML